MAATAQQTAPEYVDVYDGEQGETARLARLPIAAITIPVFQRERKSHHRKIASEFDRTAYIVPIVMDYRGFFAALDGQQRLAATELRGMTDAIVLLIEGVKNEKRAAALYLKYNRDRRGLNAFEKFTGAHAAEDPGTVEITRILLEYGLRAAPSASSATSVPAGAVTAIHSTYGCDVLSRVLEVRELAWGDANDRESRESRTLRGLATFMRSYFDRVDDNHLVDVLRKHHPSNILSKATGNAHGSIESRYADYIKDLYNRPLPRGKKRL